MATNKLRPFLDWELWTLIEAAYLLCGQVPRSERDFIDEDRDSGRDVAQVYRRLKDATLAGSLQYVDTDGALMRRRVAPSNALDWATTHGFKVPAALRPEPSRRAVAGGAASKGAAQSLPAFAREAWPQQVPPELLRLPPETMVRWEDSSGVTQMRAADVRAEIKEVTERQREGYFTLDEAAQVLVESRLAPDPNETVMKLRLAHSKGELPIHQGRSRFPLEVGETIHNFWDLLEATELDAWLRAKRVGYGFPPALVTESKEGPTTAPEAPKQRRARLLAMIDAEIAAGGERGALARITKIEKRTRPTADRSNIGRDIKKGREERDAERRGGALTRLLR